MDKLEGHLLLCPDRHCDRSILMSTGNVLPWYVPLKRLEKNHVLCLTDLQ